MRPQGQPACEHPDDEMDAVFGHGAVSLKFWVAASPALVLFCHLRCFNFFRMRSTIRKDGAPTERSSVDNQSQSIAARPSRFDFAKVPRRRIATRPLFRRRRHKNERNNLVGRARRFLRRPSRRTGCGASARAQLGSQSRNVLMSVDSFQLRDTFDGGRAGSTNATTLFFPVSLF